MAVQGYAKVFAQMYSGSMYGAGLHVFAVWGWILANKNAKGLVEVNPLMVAHMLGGQPEDIQDALRYLMEPDPASRTKDEEGRRIIKVGEYEYRVVNHDKYRDKGRDRAAYMRKYRQEQKEERTKEEKEKQQITDTDTDAVRQRNHVTGYAGYSFTEEAIMAMAIKAGVPDSFAYFYYLKYESQDWKQGSGQTITNPASHMKLLYQTAPKMFDQAKDKDSFDAIMEKLKQEQEAK